MLFMRLDQDIQSQQVWGISKNNANKKGEWKNNIRLKNVGLSKLWNK